MLKSRVLKVVSFLILMTFASAGFAANPPRITTPMDDHLAECREALKKIDKHEKAMEVVSYVSKLEDKLEKLRALNSQHERVSTIERARRFAYMRQKLLNGQLSQVVNLYRINFRETELAYYNIPYYEAEIKRLSKLTAAQKSELGKDVDGLIKSLEKNLNEAYTDLGENYVEYVIVRDFLEKQILSDVQVRNKDTLIFHNKLTEEDFTNSWRAKYVLDSLGHEDVSNRLKDLGIDPNVRPETEKIRDLFRTRIQPMIALLKRDISEERGTRVFKFSYWAIAGLQRAIMLLGSKGITIKGLKLVSSPLIQDVLGSLLLMSRDDYLRRQYLHTLENLMQTPERDHQRVKVLMEHCNEKCNELLETFARLGYVTDEWSRLKDEVESLKDESKQYARLLKLMNEAENIAEERHGLALNYHQLSDDRGKQSIFSAAAVAFWTTLLTGHGADVIQVLQSIQTYLLSFFGAG